MCSDVVGDIAVVAILAFLTGHKLLRDVATNTGSCCEPTMFEFSLSFICRGCECRVNKPSV